MKIRTCLPLLLAVAAIPATALADNYFGADLMMLDYQEDGVPGVEPKGIQVKFGTQMNENLGVEARIGTGLSAGTYPTLFGLDPFGNPVFFTDGEVKIDMAIGGYLTTSLPLNDSFNVYAVFGLTHIEATTTGNRNGVPVSLENSGNEFSYGAGISIDASDEISVGIEYMSLVDNGDVAIKSLNLGLKSYF